MKMMNKHVMILGMARSGIAVARLLHLHGARVRINDIKSESELGEALDPLRQLSGIEWRLGERAEDCISGMDMLVISPGVPIDSPVVALAREMGIEVAGELEIALRLSLGKLIAITGTNGKTTTTTLVGEMMKNAGKVTHVVGNIGNPASAVAYDAHPDDVIVCEVSSFQLESVRDIRPDISAILNITEDHLYRHKTMETYTRMKARIFMNQGEGSYIVLNYDDPALRSLTVPPKAQIVWFSRTSVPPFGAFVRDGSIVFGSNDSNRAVCRVDELGIAGSHNIENALAAAAIGICADVPVPVIRHTFRSFGGVEHRLEFVREIGDVRYINDSKGTNVESTLRAIEAMTRPTIIILGGQNKDADFARLGEAIAANAKIAGVVLLGEAEGDLAEMLDAADIKGYARAGYDLERAIELASGMAEPGGCVLLSPACKSFDMFEDYEQRGRAYKQLVMAL